MATTRIEHSTLEAQLRADLAAWEAAGLRRRPRTVHRRQGARLWIDDREIVDVASNDYLGLAGDPRLAEAAARALARGPVGAAAARLICGEYEEHRALEREIAAFLGAEDALLFGSGYLANIGALPALAGEGDVIYSDALNHASLIDGCRLARARVRVVPHGDVAALAAMLREDYGRTRRRWIVVDGVFSMDGDLAPLADLVALARRYDAWIYLDDAHATGVLGPTGRGSAERWGVMGEVAATVVTLGKAFGAAGACVVGSATVREWLLQRARSFVFTTAPPPAVAAAARAALRIVQDEPERRARLWALAAHLREALRAYVGLEVPADGAGHIVPVIVGDAAAAVQLGAALFEEGYWVGAVRPPTVPPGTARLRLSLSAAHTPADLEGLAQALGRALRRLRLSLPRP